MKIAQIVNPDFHIVLQKLATKELPAKTAFKLRSIIKLVNDEFKKHEEIRGEVLQKYGKKDENGNLITNETNNVQFNEEDIAEFIKEIDYLMKKEVNVPTIKLSELSEVSLSTQDVDLLIDLLIED